MQFLVYLTVLMVSISAVLLEVHWLTSPAPQPKPTAPAMSSPAPAPKVEGPNATLRPVYPKPPDTTQPDSVSTQQAQHPAGNNSATVETTGQAAPATATPKQETARTSQPAPVQQAPAANAKGGSPQTSSPETTGVAARENNPRQATADSINASNRSDPGREAGVEISAVGNAAPANRCDVQACASAYRSFRASDCTYQPFEGARRSCGKPPIQGAREQREQSERRRLSRDVELRYLDRPAARRQIEDDDENDDSESGGFDDSGHRGPTLFFFGGRPRW